MSRAANLVVSDQITEQYAEEQDHTSASLAKSCQDQEESPSDSIMPTEQSGRSKCEDEIAVEQNNANNESKDVDVALTDSDSVRVCAASPAILGDYHSNRQSSRKPLPLPSS